MIALDPNDTVELVLMLDRDKPEAERPTFQVRHLTCREWMQYRRTIEEAAKLEDEAAMDKLLSALRLALVNWRNVTRAGKPVAFSVAELPAMLTVGEFWELVYGVLHHTSNDETDRKNSRSQSGSGTGSSAPTAPAT